MGEPLERVLAGPPCRTYAQGHRAAGQRSGDPESVRETDAIQHDLLVSSVNGWVGTQNTAQGGATVLPRSGEVLRVTSAASVQFSRPIMFRVIRVHDWQTYDGWAWLDGYQLDPAGDAVERRSIFVQVGALQRTRGQLWAGAATPAVSRMATHR